MSDLPGPLPDGWTQVGATIHRRFVFADFVEAFGFMTRLALEAERRNHHPDWSNSWNTVDITLTSHDTGAVTTRDLELAEAANRLAAA